MSLSLNVSASAVVQEPQVVVNFNEVDKFQFYLYGTLLYSGSSLLSTPFMLLKRRQQMGIPASLFSVWKSEGVNGLFRSGSLSWVSGVNRMIYFTIYEHVVSFFEKYEPTEYNEIFQSPKVHKSMISAFAAASGSITSQAILTPLAVVTTSQHVHKVPSTSARAVVKSILANHGNLRVLWTGYTSALVQAIPTNFTLFAVYTYTKNYCHEQGWMKTPNMDLFARFGCSLLGTYAAVMVTSPIDIVRTHRQAFVSHNINVLTVPVAVPSSWVIAKNIYSEFGLWHMFRGASARLLSSTPFTIAMLIGYDYVKQFSRICDNNCS